ncbi:MAG: hypothetical protein FJ405_13655 [Verrucomicrobia bacterium]|nr:hypothetical protein [Verrucomicrobiota bacterium]
MNVRASASMELRGGFTLVEVMVATFVFFTVTFAVLSLTTRGAVAAKALQTKRLDPGMIAALITTNRFLEEGSQSGDFGDMFPDSSFSYSIEQVGTNGLFRVDFVVSGASGKSEDAMKMSALFFRPGSPPGSRFGGLGK